jgi:hypothetical protein
MLSQWVLLRLGRKSGDPERIEVQQIPQLTGQPTGTPLSGATKFQVVQSDLNDLTIQLRWSSVGREKGHLLHGAVRILDHFDRFDPGGALGIVDFAKVENLPLNHFGVQGSMILNDTPVPMFFAVFDPNFVSKEHGRQCIGEKGKIKRVGRHYKQNRESECVISKG